MKTGESFTDSQGTTWTVGQELGRGGYARAYVARSATGREAVVKASLEPADLFGDEAAALADACAQIVVEQAALMRERTKPWLPELLGEADLPGGVKALLMPRVSASLATRIRAGAPLSSVLTTLLQATEAAQAGPHGNLRPQNILIVDDARPWLADPITPTYSTHLSRLEARAVDRASVRPPEPAPDTTATLDTYALCLALYRAAMAPPAGADTRRDDPVTLPTDGLDKPTLARLKDRVLARLDTEKANPRFAPRVADKLCALLNRGLSRQATPSPPYRFSSAAELRPRFSELVDLIDPKVQSVGKVLLAAAAREGVFAEGTPASFSTTVTCTEGITHEDLAAGLLVRDLDADDDDRVPVPDARFTVKPHPSGRLRFDFSLPELRPGRYTVRIAFAVKDSDHPPATTDGHFELRPPPGYVPPAEDPPPSSQAIPFPGSSSGRPSLGLDTPRFEPTDPDEHDPFPTPIAPSDPGSLEGLDDAPPPTLEPGRPAPRGPAGLAAVPSIAPAPPAEPGASLGNAGHSTERAPPPSDLRTQPPRDQAPHAPDRASASSSGPPHAAVDIEEATAEAPVPQPSASGAASRSSGGLTPRGWTNPGTWEELPSPDLGHEPTGLGPGEPLSDLPPIDDGMHQGAGLPAPIQSVLDLLRDNPWVAMGTLVAGLVLLLAVTGVIFQSCAS